MGFLKYWWHRLFGSDVVQPLPKVNVPVVTPIVTPDPNQLSPQNDALATLSLQLALKEVGQKESTGNNDGPFVNGLQEWYGGKGEDGAPWCALFCTYEIYQAAQQQNIKPVIPKSDSSTDIYAFAKEHGLLLDQPISKCIGLLKGDGGTSGKTHHHTFRVISVDFKAGVVNSVDGNWGDQVALTTHPIRMCDFVAVC